MQDTFETKVIQARLLAKPGMSWGEIENLMQFRSKQQKSAVHCAILNEWKVQSGKLSRRQWKRFAKEYGYGR